MSKIYWNTIFYFAVQIQTTSSFVLGVAWPKHSCCFAKLYCAKNYPSHIYTGFQFPDLS